jgi:hypothetical protein
VTRFAAWALAVAACSAGPAALIGFPRAAFCEEPPADSVDQAMKLSEEAKPFEQVAGDTDASPEERRTARKTAYEKLKKSRHLLDAWLDAHPDDQDRLDKWYSDIAVRYFWIKKMMPAEELTGEGPTTSTAGPTPPTGGGSAPPSGGGPTPPSGGSSAPAKPPAEPPKPVTATDALAGIEAYAAKHKGDVPGLYERYQDFLAKYPDPSTPEYATAMAQVADLGKRMKDVYRLIHDDDPDSVKNVDGAQTEKLLGQLLDDLDKGEAPVRERAARFLGALGSGKAADPLIKTLKKEKSGAVFDACADALARIGGRRVCERVAKLGGDEAMSEAVVGILQKVMERGGPEGRVAGEALGGYVGTIPAEKRPPIFHALQEAGQVGALGLARGLEFAPPEDTVKLMEKFYVCGEPRVVTYLAKFLVVNAPGDRADFAREAREQITKIGKPGVRYLIPALDDKAVALWTAKLLQKITGEKLKDDARKTWWAWFQANRKSLEGK